MTECACGHVEAGHLDDEDGLDYRPCFVSDATGRICPCSGYRPRVRAGRWIKAANALLRRLA